MSCALARTCPRLYTGHEEGLIRMWDTDTCDLVGVVRIQHPGTWIMVMVLSSDDTCLYSGTNDNFIHVWNVHTRETVHMLELKDQPMQQIVRSLALSDDQSRLYAATYQGVWVWDTRTGTRLTSVEFQVPGFGRHFTSVRALFMRNKHLYTGCQDGRVRVWNTGKTPIANTTTTDTTTSTSDDTTTTTAVTPNATVTTSITTTITTTITTSTSTITHNCLETLEGGTSWSVHGLIMSHDSRLVFSSHTFGELKVWDMSSKACIAKEDITNIHEQVAAESLAISPDDRWLYVGFEHGTIRVWDVICGVWSENPLLMPDIFPNHLSLTLSEDGLRLYSIMDNNQNPIYVWNRQACMERGWCQDWIDLQMCS